MKYDEFFVKNVLSQVPINIFLKDKECRYVFITHPSNYLKKSKDAYETMIGKTDFEVDRNSRSALLAYNEDKKVLETGKGTKYVVQETDDEGKKYFEVLKNPVFDDDGNVVGIVGMLNDITFQIEYKQNIEEYTSYDMMTGLYNQKGFTENINKVFSNYPDKPVVIILMTCNLGDDAVISYNNTLYLANSLRIPLTPDKICARIHDNVFAVALSLNTDEKPRQRVESFITDVNKSREAFTASVSEFEHPVLKKVFDVIEQKEIDNLDEVLERLSFEIESLLALECKNDMSDKKKYIKLREMIYKYPEREWNIKDITEGMAVSKSHFFRTYKKYFMISCAADIISARIKKATELLKYTDLNISEIALRCGYSTENYFTRQFRDSMGMTASQYRAKHKK